MAKRLVKRNAPSDVPKPLPSRGNEEPETTLCKEVVSAITEADRVSDMGKCVKCKIRTAHSIVDKLCYSCHREANGFEFDEDQKRWVKKGKK